MPESCPVCGSIIVRQGAYYICPAGLSCEAQLVGRIIHYAARDAMDIEGLGDKTVKALVDRGLVKDIADLYQFSVDDIQQLEGYAEKSSAKKPALDDKTFVFTGSLENFTRDQAKEKIEMLGGRATSSVSGQTDYLVVGEGPGSKLDEAKKQDVEVLDEAAFKDLIGE